MQHLLEVHLWHPMDAIKRAEESLPKHVRRKEYKEAAECQTKIIRAKNEIVQWNELIDVALSERRLLERVSESFGEKDPSPLALAVRSWLNAYSPESDLSIEELLATKKEI